MRGSQKHLIAAVCTALAALSLTAAPAAARERSVRGEITTDRGRHVDVARDIASQPGGRDARTILGFQDGTSITQTNSRARGDHSLSANRQTEFRDGTSRSVSRERVGNGEGTGEVTRTVTNRDGETRTQSGAYEIKRAP